MFELPVESALPDVRKALAVHGRAVLIAPPGAGKTTLVPLRLLGEEWLGDRGIVMLEPRRLVARAAASRMAALLDEAVGERVGYRIRRDARVGPLTRIEVVTEGILTRMLQSDPALERVGLVIFDEFHERNLHSDLGLALSLQSRSLLRPDLRLLVMSATLDAAPVATLLGEAPVIHSEGRRYPVQVRHRPPARGEREEGATLRVIGEALEKDHGDILVFLPGAAEIRRMASSLHASDLLDSVVVVPLFGMLTGAEQDLAILPDRAGRRKIVLATSIAETSLTIEGVTTVVDSGRMRVPRFSPRTGMQRLETVRVSRASASQRCGRAGRLEPGVCYRIWSEEEEGGLIPRSTPEIREADLAPLALELASWGTRDPLELSWIDPPPAPALAQARELLEELGALGPVGTITAHGREIARLGAHPRLAHLLLKGVEEGHGSLACDLAALLGERDLIRPGVGDARDPDIRLRLDLLSRARRGAPLGTMVDASTLRRILEESADWRRRLRIREVASGSAEAGRLLALAFPDRIARRRAGSSGRFLLRNGRGAALPGEGSLTPEEYLVVAEVDDAESDARIHLAAPLSVEDLVGVLSDRIREEAEVLWDSAGGGVSARIRTRLGAIVLRDAPWTNPEPERVLEAILGAIQRGGVGLLPWSPEARKLQSRILFMKSLEPGWPDVSDEALGEDPASWLEASLRAMLPRPRLGDLDVAGALGDLLDWRQRAALDGSAPADFTVPSGSRLRIDYTDPSAPVLAVRLQEMFGLRETPRIAGGRVPLLLHLLSPAQRPVQVTRDLAGFWERGYFDVRKDLRGRYPKHHWPDDPLEAAPTRSVRRRGRGEG